MGSAPLSAPFTLALTFRLHSRLRIYLYAALLPFLQAYSFVCMRHWGSPIPIGFMQSYG